MTNHFDVCIQASSLELLHHELSLHVAEGFYDSCVEPEESWPPLKIAFKSKRSSLLSEVPLRLSSNVVNMTLPVHIFHGRLNVSSIPISRKMLEHDLPANLAEAVRRRKPGMSGGNVDLSTLEMDFTLRSRLLLVHNPTPVLVTDLAS